MPDAPVITLLKDYISIPSVSATPEERIAARWVHKQLVKLPYFQENPSLVGLYPCTEDVLEREIPWGLLLGKSKDTMVLFHHLDVVNATDFGADEPLAWKVDALKDAYKERSWPEVVQKDLDSGEWVFGRGSCDMKGGGAAQIAFLSELARGEQPPVSVLLLAVPDEENLSVGMRNAVALLDSLKETHKLRYRIAVNSEPNFGKDDSAVTLFAGSVGKATALAVAQGVRCHTGNPFEGISAVAILSAIVSASDGQIGMADPVIPPPAWMSIRDLKEMYDVSLPDRACGSLNVLFDDSPVEALTRLKTTFLSAFKGLLENRRMNCSRFIRNRQLSVPWRDFDPKVIFWSELHEMVQEQGYQQQAALEEERRKVTQGLEEGMLSYQQATTELVLKGIELSGFSGPLVVLALVPPVYPAVHCDKELVDRLRRGLEEPVRKVAGVPLEIEPLFMGISDLSYLGLEDPRLTVTLPENLPVWPEGYQIPLQGMAKLNMPGINIGPRGKDLHQPTERVLIKDLVQTLPEVFRTLVMLISEN